MIRATVCYIKCDDKILMINRDRKKNDPEIGKWLGVGGKFKEGENAIECVIREIKEETGLELEEKKLVPLGYELINSPQRELMKIFVFYTEVSKEKMIKEYMADNKEGKFEWISESKVLDLKLWENDKEYIKNLGDRKLFRLGYYRRGENGQIDFKDEYKQIIINSRQYNEELYKEQNKEQDKLSALSFMVDRKYEKYHKNIGWGCLLR